MLGLQWPGTVIGMRHSCATMAEYYQRVTFVGLSYVPCPSCQVHFRCIEREPIVPTCFFRVPHEVDCGWRGYCRNKIVLVPCHTM